ncbi:putative aminodeoxychorismate lyase [Leminorella richardii]|uniref:Endolytic murein transglycosylase n=1 Tax=Leminorella richardii TaxID=158841 RepID=A0A2X4XWQ9_9GAMM|nr:endolytic transglycosylase MltG [Leminorella richardii]SQI41044.1 putative aminodeoxychorismate lyase [Leminorella richardii]
MKKKLIGILAVAVLAGAAGAFAGYQWLQNYAQRPLSLKEPIYFTLPSGTGQAALGNLLVEKGVVSDVKALPWLLRLQPDLGGFKAGTYQLTPEMDIKAMLLLFRSGKEAQFSIRFIEGTRMQDWIPLLAQAPYVKHTLEGASEEKVAEVLAINDPAHPEGWLYPDTYNYTAGTTDRALLKRAHEKMKKTVDEVWNGREENLPYKTPYEMMIMASIIEKETALDSERDKVASVFVNRMRIGMKLQTDPTVIYGMGSQYNGNITRKDLTTPTAYNTYTIDGLPPTPIAMPGQASLKAAAHPAKTNYLYFVADGKGGHTFTTNLQSHNQAVRQYLQTLRAGKQ